ncbi:MAG TPA: PstS family phosphate ABC transporter substrate-binding protein [Myxococcota bacterium]|nr:PstS family phosphate ABC transporter substrate-binding protein [Myxococcota bacterium]
MKSLIGAVTVALLFWQSCTCSLSKDNIKLDGSSTVFVISEAIAEEYKKQNQENVSIGISGTGGGFKKFCSKRIDIIGASRAITDSEKELCRKNAVDYVELPVANDGIVVVVNKENSWLNDIRVSTLRKIFEPAAEGKITKWSDVNPAWPDRKFEIFAPGIASGTYDYFTKEIVGKEHSSRGDITSSEDDNVLVHGIRSTLDSIGFFSFAYYLENQSSLKALAIINDLAGINHKPVLPTAATIQSGAYQPLARPVFLYAAKELRPNERNFVKFYLENCSKIAKDVGFVPLSEEEQKAAFTKLAEE